MFDSYLPMIRLAGYYNIFIFFFWENKAYHLLCDSSARQMINMKCCLIFSEKKKKKYFKMSHLADDSHDLLSYFK